MNLLLIRHGESLGNTQQRMMGQLEDPLSPSGILQAQRLGQYLSGNGVPTSFYCSPLQRATKTLEIIGSCHPALADPLPIQTTEALLEIQNGIFQGLTWPEAEQLHPELCQQLMGTQEWIPIPKGETLVSCCDRTQNFIQTLYQTHNNTDRIWIVTHGGILQYLIAAILKMPQIWGIQIDNTALFEFELDPTYYSQVNHHSQLCRILRFNDRPHLTPGVFNAPSYEQNLRMTDRTIVLHD